MRYLLLLVLLPLLALAPAAARAQAESDPVAKDLGTVIALQGKPCGGVRSYRKLAENDYAVDCATGDRYRVHVGPEGRVRVDRR